MKGTQTSIALLLLGAVALLASQARTPGATPAQIQNKKALVQASNNPLSSGNYSNEQAIYDAVVGSISTREALEAAMNAAQQGATLGTGHAYVVKNTMNQYKPETEREELARKIRDVRTAIARNNRYAKGGKLSAPRQRKAEELQAQLARYEAGLIEVFQ